VSKTPTQIKSLARAHTERAIQVLQGIMDSGSTEAARVTAANSLLDRAWGKPAQAHAGPDGEGAVAIEVSWTSNDGESS
jgi:hypothetical protein